MKTSFAKPFHRSPSYTKFATPLVLDPPRHSGLPTIQLGLGKHLLGTSHDCSVQVWADGVQPRHAMIVVSAHRTVVKALDPRTWVNEGPISEMALRPGDRLSIGPLTFRVRAASPDELADFAEANEHTPDDDNSGEAEQIVEPSVKRPSVASVVAEPRQSVASTRAPADELPRLDSSATRGPETALPPRYSVVSSIAKLPIVATDSIAATADKSSDMAMPTPSVIQPAPIAVVATNASAQAVDAPVAWSASTDSLEYKLNEIEQQLADLQQSGAAQSASTDALAPRTDDLAAERHQLTVREEDLQRRASEFAHQSQQLAERVSHVAEREANLERSQSQLALEHEQLRATSEMTRKELDEEYRRQMTLWQEWDAAYRRTSGELNGQLQSIEQRRVTLQAEGERLASERSEVQRLQAEHERDRRAHAAERLQLTTDRAAFQSLRAEFDSERHHHLVSVQERETRVAAERQSMSLAQEELLGARQQVERDRTDFLAERAADAMRRERELREHAELRERLDRDHARIQAERLEVNELRRVVETRKAALDFEREAFASQQAAIAAERVELSQLCERLQQAESDLVRLQHALEASRSFPTPAATMAAIAVPSEMDWFAEPYKSLQLPPPVPTDGTAHEPFNDSRGEVTTTAPSLPDIVPLISAVPARVEEPQSPADEITQPFGNGVRSDADVRHTSSAPFVAAPAAVSPRFWEDNTLYDTSVSSYAQPPIPTTFVASSNVMSDSATTSNDAASFPTTASNDAGERFPSSQPFGVSSLDDIHAMWHRSPGAAIPEMATEYETFKSTATMTADIAPTVDETLAEVNRQFGLPLPAQKAAPIEHVAALPGWWSTDPAIAAATVDDNCRADHSSSKFFTNPGDETVIAGVATHFSGMSEDTTATQSESHDSLSDLRSQLAKLFDLPAQGSCKTRVEDVSPAADAPTMEESSPGDVDRTEQTLARSDAEIANALPPENNTNTESGSVLPSGGDKTAGAESASSAQATEAISPPDISEVSTADDSVEAYMARLLSRTRGGAEVSAGEAKSLAASITTSDETSGPRVVLSSESPTGETALDLADRSHLTAEPKHKQDRQAAREDLQSFRLVAHQSARSALARHTSKNLMSAVVAKSFLLGVSTLATTAFFGAPLVGLPIQFWKGVACSVAMLLSAVEFLRSWRQFRKWQTKGVSFGSTSHNSVTAATTNSSPDDTADVIVR